MRKIWSKNFIGVFIGIAVIAFFLRLYNLGLIPPGLTNDEANIGYDAYSILLTGKDQWGNFIPLTAFKGFGDYRLPLYTYLVVPLISIFDLNSFSVRLPSAISGVMSVILIFFLAKKFFEKSHISSSVISFGAMIFMAISPWGIGLSRIGIESNVAISIFLLGFIVFLYAFKRPILFIISFTLFALTIYMYTSYSLFIPILIIVLILNFKKIIMKNKKHIFISIILFIIIVAPLYLMRSAVGTRASQVLFINSQDSVGLRADLNDRRGACIEIFPDFLCKITENKYNILLNNFIRNYINHFSFNFLYLSGTTTQYSILPQRSLLYTFELAFLILGIIAMISKKIKNRILVLFLLFLSPIPDALTGDGHFSRASNMMPFLFLTEGIGFSYFYQTIKSWKGRKIFYSGISVLILISLTAFITSYFSYFPKYYSFFSQYGYEEMTKKVYNKKTEYDRIYISRFFNDSKQYIYYLFYNKYDPVKFQRKENIDYSIVNNWVSIDRIENIYFVDKLPELSDLERVNDKKILLVTHPSELPENVTFTDVIYDKNHNKVFVFVKILDYLKSMEEHKKNL